MSKSTKKLNLGSIAHINQLHVVFILSFCLGNQIILASQHSTIQLDKAFIHSGHLHNYGKKIMDVDKEEEEIKADMMQKKKPLINIFFPLSKGILHLLSRFSSQASKQSIHRC